MLHIGAFRTALFSWLLARHGGGDFILRIEDTDQKRLVSGSLANIIESLHDMGVIYDEGPDEASVGALADTYGPVPLGDVPADGGAFGPYFQSQRLGRYREVVEDLLARGKAYYAFETTEELEAARADAEARKVPYRYDRQFRDYPLADAQARVAAGERYVVRFKMPTEGTIRTVDALRGPTDWDAETQDDFVILKGDGFPPYHLAAMVDDHDMEISHVLRGEEWISSFPKHVAIFDAMGWELPVFVHTPSVLGPDGKKLAKRNGAKGVGEFVADGFLPEALVNYLALVGWAPGDDAEVMPLGDIIRKFTIAGISPSPAEFDDKKMAWMNQKYVGALAPDLFVEMALPFLIRAEILPKDPSPELREYAGRVMLLEHEKVKLLADVVKLTDFFFTDLPQYEEKSVAKWLKRDGVADYLADAGARLADLKDWSHDPIEATVLAAAQANGRERGEMTHPMRVAVSGRETGPGLYEMMAVLGRERTLHRLTHAGELARG